MSTILTRLEYFVAEDDLGQASNLLEDAWNRARADGSVEACQRGAEIAHLVAQSDDRRIRRSGEKWEGKFRELCRAILGNSLAAALREDEMARAAWKQRSATSDTAALADALEEARARLWPLYIAVYGERKTRIDLCAPPTPDDVTPEQLYESREAAWQAFLEYAAKDATEDCTIAELDAADHKARASGRELSQRDPTFVAVDRAAVERDEAHALWDSYSIELESMLRVADPELCTWLVRVVACEIHRGRHDRERVSVGRRWGCGTWAAGRICDRAVRHAPRLRGGVRKTSHAPRPTNHRQRYFARRRYRA